MSTVKPGAAFIGNADDLYTVVFFPLPRDWRDAQRQERRRFTWCWIRQPKRSCRRWSFRSGSRNSSRKVSPQVAANS
jgi:hypothetical protein